MLDELKAISSTSKDLKSFAQVMTIACALIGGLLYWRGKEHWRYFLIASGVFLFFRFVWPQALLPIQKIWMGFAVAMGWIMSRIILSILWIAGFTTLGLIGRILGKSFLDVKLNKDSDTYWIKRPVEEIDPSRYEKQF